MSIDEEFEVVPDELEPDGCFDLPGGEPHEPPTRGGQSFPISPRILPTWLTKGFTNGRIPEDRMERVADCGRHGFMIPEAAAAWRSFTAAAAQAGFQVTMTGAYRPYEDQVTGFLQRYTTVDNGTKPKVWNGTNYYLTKGLADLSTPGNSNHGWGAAVDMALGPNPKAAKEVTKNPAFMTWAVANARTHGWSWENWEPWHLRLVAIVGGAPASNMSTMTKPVADKTPAPPAAAGAVPEPELKEGMEGEAVAALQQILVANGWAGFTKADGKFGPKTTAAVMAMQGALGCRADGAYGPRTATALKNHLARGGG